MLKVGHQTQHKDRNKNTVLRVLSGFPVLFFLVLLFWLLSFFPSSHPHSRSHHLLIPPAHSLLLLLFVASVCPTSTKTTVTTLPSAFHLPPCTSPPIHLLISSSPSPLLPPHPCYGLGLQFSNTLNPHTPKIQILISLFPPVTTSTSNTFCPCACVIAYSLFAISFSFSLTTYFPISISIFFRPLLLYNSRPPLNFSPTNDSTSPQPNEPPHVNPTNLHHVNQTHLQMTPAPAGRNRRSVTLTNIPLPQGPPPQPPSGHSPHSSVSSQSAIQSYSGPVMGQGAHSSSNSSFAPPRASFSSSSRASPVGHSKSGRGDRDREDQWQDSAWRSIFDAALVKAQQAVQLDELQETALAANLYAQAANDLGRVIPMCTSEKKKQSMLAIVSVESRSPLLSHTLPFSMFLAPVCCRFITHDTDRVHALKTLTSTNALTRVGHNALPTICTSWRAIRKRQRWGDTAEYDWLANPGLFSGTRNNFEQAYFLC